MLMRPPGQPDRPAAPPLMGSPTTARGLMAPDEEIAAEALRATIVQVLWLMAIALGAIVAVGIQIQYS
jgi:hypothetical protein